MEGLSCEPANSTQRIPLYDPGIEPSTFLLLGRSSNPSSTTLLVSTYLISSLSGVFKATFYTLRIYNNCRSLIIRLFYLFSGLSVVFWPSGKW